MARSARECFLQHWTAQLRHQGHWGGRDNHQYRTRRFYRLVDRQLLTPTARLRISRRRGYPKLLTPFPAQQAHVSGVDTLKGQPQYVAIQPAGPATSQRPT